MGYGILAKNPEAECVDDFSIWTQKKKKNTFMSIANDGYKNKQSRLHFFGSIIFLRISLSFLCFSPQKELCVCVFLQAKISEVLC